MLKLRKNKKGFTLVELMVVVVIIGILTAIAIPVYSAVTANAQTSACLANQRTIDSAVMVYRADAVNDGAIPTFAVLSVDKTYLAAVPTCPSKVKCVYTIDPVSGLCKSSGAGGTGHILHSS